VGGGAVTNITITNPGFGYAANTTITIAPPTEAFLSPNVTQVMKLNFGNLSPYDDYQLKFTPAVIGVWSNLGTLFIPTSATNTQFINVTGATGFFQVEHLP
jgi:hypothetical protein